MLLALTSLISRFAAQCSVPSSSFTLSFPTWYEYLKTTNDPISGKCIPTISSLNDFLAIGLAAVDILLHLAGLIALGYILYGAFLYINSHGEPDKITEAKDSIINAVIGLVIVLIAIVVVSFIGGKFS